MSTAHVTTFAEFVAKDRALRARLGLDQVSDEASAAAFFTKAVEEAKTIGLEFTDAEARAWYAAEAEAGCALDGELSDAQLETVAGGKDNPPIKPFGCGVGGAGMGPTAAMKKSYEKNLYSWETRNHHKHTTVTWNNW